MTNFDDYNLVYIVGKLIRPKSNKINFENTEIEGYRTINIKTFECRDLKKNVAMKLFRSQLLQKSYTLKEIKDLKDNALEKLFEITNSSDCYIHATKGKYLGGTPFILLGDYIDMGIYVLLDIIRKKTYEFSYQELKDFINKQILEKTYHLSNNQLISNLEIEYNSQGLVEKLRLKGKEINSLQVVNTKLTKLKDEKEVYIPYGTKEITDSAFAECKNVEIIHLIEGIEKFSDRVMSKLPNLQKQVLNIKKSTEYTEKSETQEHPIELGVEMWGYCKKLQAAQIPLEATKVPRRSFAYCSNLESTGFPWYLEEIEKQAYIGCKKLVPLELPNTLKKIGKQAFQGCTSLKLLNISKNLEEIGDLAFYRCASLDLMYIPEKVKTIGKGAFARSGLQGIEFAGGNLEIKEKAFYNCKELVVFSCKLKLPKICSDSFDGCDKLKIFRYYLNEGTKDESMIEVKLDYIVKNGKYNPKIKHIIKFLNSTDEEKEEIFKEEQDISIKLSMMLYILAFSKKKDYIITYMFNERLFIEKMCILKNLTWLLEGLISFKILTKEKVKVLQEHFTKIYKVNYPDLRH